MNDQSGIKVEIEACEQQFYQAMLSPDVSLLEELLSDELVFVGPGGEIVSKEMDLELHRSGGMQVAVLEPRELEIRCLNEAGVAVSRIFLSGSFQGVAFEGEFRYMRVWQRTEKGWRIIAGQCNLIS